MLTRREVKLLVLRIVFARLGIRIEVREEVVEIRILIGVEQRLSYWWTWIHEIWKSNAIYDTRNVCGLSANVACEKGSFLSHSQTNDSAVHHGTTFFALTTCDGLRDRRRVVV